MPQNSVNGDLSIAGSTQGGPVDVCGGSLAVGCCHEQVGVYAVVEQVGTDSVGASIGKLVVVTHGGAAIGEAFD